MPKLCEVVAVVKDRKEAGQKALTEAYHAAQKRDLFDGVVKRYQPLKEDGERLPDEVQPLRATVANLIESFRNPVERLLDVTRTQDDGNLIAKATVVVGDENAPELTLEDVPATHLLYLEKVAKDLLTFATNLPTLDPATVWSDDGTINRGEPSHRFRTQKVQEPIVLYPATDHHPAQTQLISRDVNVGTWVETKVSGAVTIQYKREMIERATKLMDSVRTARERANSTQVTPMKEGKLILDYVLGE